MTIDRYQEMKDLEAEGVSKAEIGRRFGLSRERVGQILAGPPPGAASVRRSAAETPAWAVLGTQERAARDADIRARHHAGETFAAIGRHHGLSRDRVMKIVRAAE